MPFFVDVLCELEEDMELIKEENRNEYDLQLSIAEIMGIIFKTHKELASTLTTQLTSCSK